MTVVYIHRNGLLGQNERTKEEKFNIIVLHSADEFI